MHIELLSYFTTAAGASGAAAAAVSGDSLVVKNCNLAKGPAQVLNWWPSNQAAGFHQLTFPSGHDTTRGIRERVRITEIDLLLPLGIGFPVQPQETISATIGGSATAGDVETGSLLLFYPDLPGVTQRTIDWPTLQKRLLKITTVDMAITGAAAGYTGSAALNSIIDLLMANQDYALLGITTSLATGAVTVKGPDTGNVRVGVPGNATFTDIGIDFFCYMARAFGLPIIPVINSGNKASTFVEILQNENNITPTVTLMLGLLAPAK